MTITASIGYYYVPENEKTDLDSFINRADEALYRAKAAGRNRVRD